MNYFITIILGFICFVNTCFAKTYFIDFENGDDKNSGLTKSKPFQHYPGHNDAIFNARNTKIFPGDKVIFKGGVVYRGSITIKSGGSKGAPVVLDGNTKGNFGEGRAIIDGSRVVEKVFPCPYKKSDKKLVCLRLPVVELPLHLFKNDRRLSVSSNLKYKSIYNYLNIKTFISYKYFNRKNLEKHINTIQSQDPNTNILYLKKGNQISLHRMNEARSSTKSPGSEMYKIIPNKSGQLKYMLVNQYKFLNSPEKYYIDYKNKNVYLLSDGSGISHYTYGFEKYGFNIKASNILVTGFKFQKQFGSGVREGISIFTSGSNNNPIENISIKNNVFMDIFSKDKSGVITVNQAENINIYDNSISRITRNRGILVMNSKNVVTESNRISSLGGTGIAYFKVSGGSIRNNFVSEVMDVHANGLSLYLGSKNIHVVDNCIVNGLNAVTIQSANNIKFDRNYFSSKLDFFTFADWGRSNNISINTSWIENSYKKSTLINPSSDNISISESILDGLLDKDKISHTTDLKYTSFSWIQEKKSSDTTSRGVNKFKLKLELKKKFDEICRNL